VEVNIFRSSEEWPGREIPARWKRAVVPVRRAIMAAMDNWFFDPRIAPRLNAFRAELGLKNPVRRVMREWLHSPQCVIGLFPEWFSGRYPDWPPNLHLTGFPLFDDNEARPIPAVGDEFVNGGPPPIVFTFGSAMRAARGLFEAAVEVCRRLGRRGVLLTEFADQVPASLPDTVRHLSYAPFSALFPRAAALVHHGGVGTTAQGLRAGVPQLVAPMVFDQPYNAVRLQRLGVGLSIPPRKFNPAVAAAALDGLMNSPTVADRCRETAGRFALAPNPMAETCDLIEAAMRS
jgi:rhamnosyltransferase subunit B